MDCEIDLVQHLELPATCDRERFGDVTELGYHGPLGGSLCRAWFESCCHFSVQMEAFLGIAVKPAPNQFVGNYDKNAHHRNAADDHRCIPLLGNLGYVGAETVRP